jgi:RNA polymerase sigma factor (TIGR02999 family)
MSHPEGPSGPEDPPPAAGAHTLLPLVYDQLRQLAGAYLRGEREGVLRPTEIVHEAFLKLARDPDRRYHDEVHFKATAARAMRQILVDQARARDALKRGGGAVTVTWSDDLVFSGVPQDLLRLDRAVAHLHEVDARAAEAVELSFFGGLRQSEIARRMGISERTVRDDLAHAQSWLRIEMERLQ